MNKLDNYGIYFYNNKVFVEKIIGPTQVNYTYKTERVNIDNNNGNGEDRIKFLNNENQLTAVNFGKWKLRPIIELPFNWSGYSCTFHLTDPQNIEEQYTFCFDDRSLFKKTSFLPEIQGVFDKCIEISSLYTDNSRYKEISELYNKLKVYEDKIRYLEGELIRKEKIIIELSGK